MVSSEAVEFIVGKLVERYSHPGRVSFMYMFRLAPGTDFEPLLPAAAVIQDAWMDEDTGLVPVEAAVALAHCRETLVVSKARPTNRQERRRQMARVVSFIVLPQTATQVVVELSSRALLFSPKGDRRVTEIWHPAEGGWYSVPSKYD
jgi:hypothetical protein